MTGFAGMPVLITGIAGAVGAALAEALIDAGAQVHGIVRAGTDLWRLRAQLQGHALTLHRADLRDPSTLRTVIGAVHPVGVFHLATARPGRSPESRRAMLETNVIGLFNLLEACAGLPLRRLVVAGSSLEYGPHPDPLHEAQRLEPTLFFGATKAMATLLAAQAARETGCPVTIARLFSVYGPWEAPKRLIPSAILAGVRGEPLPLTPDASTIRRDFVYTRDVAEALLRCAQADLAPGTICNVGSGVETSNADLVAIIDRLLQARGYAPLAIQAGAYPRRASDTDHWVADTAHTAALIGWRACTPLQAGLDATFDHVLAHRAEYEAHWGTRL